MTRSTAVVMVLAAALSEAAPKTLVVGAGDCDAAVLATGLSDLSAALRARLKADLYESDVVLDIVRPRPSRSLDDVQRQVESARTLFYNGQNDRALDLLRQALAELERSPLAGEPWRVMSQAHALKAVVLLALGRKPEALEAFRAVLRVEPSLVLSKDEFTPSAMAQFEALRKELGRAKRASLRVQSSTPGAEVLLEGRVMGVTPLTLSLAPASYRLLLRAGDRASFLRLVTVPRDELVQVDLAAEGALSTRTPLCLDTNAPAAVSAALRLANTVTADELILVRREGPRDAPGSFVAARYESRTGSQLREGRVQAPLKGKPAFPVLAEFLLTGQGSPFIITPDAPTSRVVVEKNQAPAEAVVVELTAEPVPAMTPPPPPPLPSSADAPLSNARVAAFVLIGVGVASATAGLVLDLQGADRRASVASLLQPSGRLPDPSSPAHREALDLLAVVAQQRTVAYSVMGAGLGALASGIVAFLLFPGTTSSVAVAPGPAGASVSWASFF